MIEETIGDRIIALRKNHKLTQLNIAKICGVTIATVSQWEAGLTSPKTLHVIALADFFRTTVHYLALGVDKKTSSISKEELLLINHFNSASPKTKEIIYMMLDMKK